MFRNLTSQLAGGAGVGNDSEAKKVLSPALRPDIYALIDSFKAWATGTGPSPAKGQPGDSVSYKPLLETIRKHIPGTKSLGLESFGQGESEIAALTGGITNMIMELSKWEGMSAGMAMRTWVDALVEAHTKASSQSRKEMIGKGVTRGLHQLTDVNLLTKDFTTRISILSCLKTASARIHGAGSDEARQSEVLWSTKLI